MSFSCDSILPIFSYKTVSHSRNTTSLYINPVHYRQRIQTCGLSRSGRRDHDIYQNAYLFITREVVGQYDLVNVCRYRCESYCCDGSRDNYLCYF